MCVHKKGKKTHYQSQPSGHGTSNDEILDDEEESMDWWTKYFASVDAMIEVIKGRFFSVPKKFAENYPEKEIMKLCRV